MKIETYTGTLIHDVPDCGTVMVTVSPTMAKMELDYATALTMAGERVRAIKHLRATLKVGLKEAHRMTAEAAKRRADEQRAQGQHAQLLKCKKAGWVTTYHLVGDTGEKIKCDTCGYVEYDAGQHRCGACARAFDNSHGDF